MDSSAIWTRRGELKAFTTAEITFRSSTLYRVTWVPQLTSCMNAWFSPLLTSGYSMYGEGFFSLWRNSPTRARAASCLRFLKRTKWHTTVGRTPLDEWSARRRSRYLTIYKVVQIWPGLIVCKQVTVCPGHIWTTLYNTHKTHTCFCRGIRKFSVHKFCILYAQCFFLWISEKKSYFYFCVQH